MMSNFLSMFLPAVGVLTLAGILVAVPLKNTRRRRLEREHHRKKVRRDSVKTTAGRRGI